MAGGPQRHSYGLAQVAFAATIWGSIPVLARAVDVSPAVIVFWRVAFAGMATGGFLLLRGRIGEIFALPKRKLAALAGMGSLLTLNWLLFFGAIQLTDVAVAVLLAYCGPVFVAALTPLVTREPFDRRVVLPLLSALAGVVIIVGPNQITLDGGPAMLGAAMAFASAFTYAILVLNAKRLVQGIPATVYMTVEYAVAVTLLLPVILLLPGPSQPIEWGSLAALGILNTAVTGFLFLSALRSVRADHAAIITYAEPVSAVIFAALFLSESIAFSTALGGVLVVAGGIAVARAARVTTVEGPPLLPDTE